MSVSIRNFEFDNILDSSMKKNANDKPSNDKPSNNKENILDNSVKKNTDDKPSSDKPSNNKQNILNSSVKKNADDKPSNDKEKAQVTLSKQKTLGSDVSSSEPVSAPAERKKFGESHSREKVNIEQPKSKVAKKNKKSGKSSSALKMILAVLVLSFIALAGMIFYLFNQSDSRQDGTDVIIDPNTSVVKAQDGQLPDVQSLDSEGSPTTDMANQAQVGVDGKPVTVDGQQPAQVNADGTQANVVVNGGQVQGQANTTSTVNQDVNNKTQLAEVQQPKPTPSTKPVTVNVPDPEKIINAEVPKDESLVKEEIDKLADEEKRLEQQEKLLDKRLKMMDELTEKKEEQIELLEKQIAQLEEGKK